MGQYKIGDKLVLWQYEYRPKAYKDQFGIPHAANVVIEEVHAVVVEVKPVPYVYGQGTGEGFRVEDGGGTSYFCCWEKYPDDSPYPYGLWYSDITGNVVLWYNAEAYGGMNLYLYPNGQRAIPEGWVRCEKHLYLSPRGCPVCAFASKRSVG